MRSPTEFYYIVVKSHIVRNEEGYAYNLGSTTHPNLLSEQRGNPNDKFDAQNWYYCSSKVYKNDSYRYDYFNRQK